MKRNIVLILILFIITGCNNNNNLTCIKSNNEIDTKITFKFIDNKISKLTYYQKTNFNTSDAYIDLYHLELKESFQKYDNVSGIVYNIDLSKRNNTITEELNIDYSKLLDTNVTIISKKDSTYDENKNNFESTGYKCN